MSLKETIRKQSNAKTIQNRTNRVNNKNKKYNKSISKSDKAYIQGDLKKSASMKAYGVQKSLAKGEKVYGYDDDDIFTGFTLSFLVNAFATLLTAVFVLFVEVLLFELAVLLFELTVLLLE